MAYNLVVYCSRSYYPVLKLTLPSFLRSDASRIILYTDSEEHPPRVDFSSGKGYELRPVWANVIGTGDVGEQCARKAHALSMAIEEDPSTPVLLLDCDCYVMAPLDHIFIPRTDVFVTSPPAWSAPAPDSRKKPAKDISAGFVGVNATAEGRAFVGRWASGQQRFWPSRNRDQRALVETTGRHGLCVAKLPCWIYNTYPERNDADSVTAWMRHLSEFGSAIHVMHFAYGLLRDPDILPRARHWLAMGKD